MSKRSVAMLVTMVLSACGPMNRDEVQCAGSTMVCDCVTSCSSELSAAADAVERGSVYVTFEEGEGCEPSCH